jgi:hypothetical protein
VLSGGRFEGRETNERERTSEVEEWLFNMSENGEELFEGWRRASTVDRAMRTRRPRVREGISPRRTHSYAVDREMPSRSATSGTV